MQDLRESYDLDVEQALEEEWAPSIPPGYHLALLRQVADQSTQCSACVLLLLYLVRLPSHN